jgi:hypothetical protein
VNQTPDQIMQSALDAFGIDHQTDKCLEELGELATALIQYRQGRIGLDVLLGELADVQVTTGQLRLHYGATSVDQIVAVKLARLSRLCADQVAKAKPEPKPKPARCWSSWCGGYNLQTTGKWLGFVQPRDTMWTTDIGKGVLNWYPTMQEAMRAVELHHGLDEVPLWP